jgi:hypothetical protein
VGETTRAHKARLAIRTFKIVADALFLRGNYTLGGKSGQALEDALRTLSPEIYGTINDPKSIELKGWSTFWTDSRGESKSVIGLF